MIIAVASCSSDEDFATDTLNRTSNITNVDDMAGNLQNSFKNDVTRAQKAMYPSYYGGMYLNENKELVILAVGDDSEYYREDLSKRCKGNRFKVEPCEYTLEVLNDGIEKLREKITSSVIADFDVKSFYLSDNENKVYIGLGDCSQGIINNFKSQVLDLPFLSFVKIDKIESHAQQIESGSPVRTNSGKSSLAYRAMYNGEVGFVTAAHAVNSMGIISYEDNGPEIAQVKNISLYVDAAFCAMLSGYEASNQTYYNFTSLNPRTESVYYGQSVTLSARYNSNSGIVLSTNFNFTSDAGYSIWGAVEASYPSQPGDSGGVVYTNSKNVAGMHVAGINSSSSHSAVFVRADEINNALSLTMY